MLTCLYVITLAIEVAFTVIDLEGIIGFVIATKAIRAVDECHVLSCLSNA